jgi:ATP-dependent RNA helicase SUPV3L1/SUV3
MAKKNKKNSNLNKRIKEYFDGDPFDVGIQRVESHTLSELFATLGFYDIEHSRNILVKTARTLWSEADSDFRLNILNFFAQNHTIYKSQTPSEHSLDRDDKIDMFMAQLDANDDEVLYLKESFATMRSKKITLQKMQNKLKHIRFEAKKQKLERSLDGIFDIDDTLEFNASIHYVLFEESFHKILTLNTKTYEYDFLYDNDEEILIQKITDDKENVVKLQQSKVENFLSSLTKQHPYLGYEEILSSLRSSPPKTKVNLPLIKEKILFKIITNIIPIEDLQVFDEEILLKLKQDYTLPFSDIVHSYNLELHIELESLLKDVWQGNKLDFTSVIDEAKKEVQKHFEIDLKYLSDECEHSASLLHLNTKELHARIYDVLLERIPNSLVINTKIIQKSTRAFNRLTRDEIIKKQRYSLLARTIRDFKNLFPIARQMRRKLILHIGATNSGKTYEAMQKLQSADTGYYLAPLRLLALEGYENLKQQGIESSLITGEEQIIDDDATHISSTIEMINFEVDVDVCVIDEVQMLDDRDRGWAWANAIIGVPAKEVIMTGSANSKDVVIALAKYLNEDLEIVEFQRKNPLTLQDVPTDVKDITQGTAIIAFSRKEVLRLKQQFSRDFSVSVVYGNLSPEVRREEARRFRSGETQILIATDAIAMGMNLPIKTILFSKAQKFDGVSQRNLFPSEIHQISGRAGRYGLHEEGIVGALTLDVLRIVKKGFYKEAKTIAIPFRVMANLEHIKLVGNILEENSLSEILNFFVKNMEFNGPFIASSLDDMLEASKIIDNYDLDIATKYHLACAPLTLKSPYIISAYESYMLALEKQMLVAYTPPSLNAKFAHTSDELLRAEDMVKEISLYLWLSYRFDKYFIDEVKARSYRGVLNKYIELSLQQAQLAQKCRLCSYPLPLNTKYNICQKCFKKNYTGKNMRRSRR